MVRHGHTEDNPQHSFPMENKERSLPESSWLCLSSHWHRNTAMSLLYPQHPKILPSQAQPLTLVTAVQPGMPLVCCPSGRSSGSFGLKALCSRRCLCEGTALTLLKSSCKFSWRLASLFCRGLGRPPAVQVIDTGYGNCSHFHRQLLKLASGHPSAASLCPHSQISSLVPPSASPTLVGNVDPRSELGSSLSQHPHLKAQGGKETTSVPFWLQSTRSLVCFQLPPQDPGFISTHDCLEQGHVAPEGGSSALRPASPCSSPIFFPRALAAQRH